MLWYLLYPVRGTSDPPKLRVENPVRRAFYRHGLTTARHWQLAMLVTVTIGVVLTYPVIFLSDFPTAGLGGLPHHVWESARSFEGRSDVQPNLEMRQIWIHGSYMRAIDKTVLQQAFSLQDAVFEGTSHIQLENDNPNEPNKVNWGFHSPLMYWGNDHQALSADSDILTLLFDYFFLITFFVAVLSVDIRRLELQDSLTRSNKRPRRKPSPERHSWVEALLHGKVPFSTRMAGSAVTTTFILALNWHFSDHSHPSSPFKLFSGFTHTQKLPIAEFDGTSPPPMNQTRSPATWLRMQDYDNAVQFMKVVDPTAHGFVAKIFDPLVVVLAGSDRNGIPLERKTWLSALRRLAITHFYPFALAVVFIIAFVTVLMNFLLWDEGAEKAELENGNPDDPRVTVEAVEAVQAKHQLDIVKIAGCRNGAFASAGLDRSVSVFSYDSNASKYVEMGVPKDMASRLAWPIHAVAVTEGGQWLALLCDDGHVAIFALPKTQLNHRISLGLDRRAPLTFGFLQQPGSSSGNPPLIAVASDGSLTEINVESGLTTTHQTGASALSAAMIMPPGLSATEVLCATPDNRLCRGRKVAGLWHFSDFFPCSPEPEQNSVYLHPSVIPLPDLHMAAIYNGTDITFLQLASLDMGLSITVEGAKPHSIRVLYADPEKCPGCGAPAVGSLAIVYTDTETQDCVMITHTFSPDATGPICLAQDTEACVKLIHVTRSEYRLAEPGAWEATSAQAIVGIRHAESPAPTPPPSPSLQPQATLRNRKARPTFQHRPESTEEWEAYAFTMTGDFHKAVTKPVEGGDSGTENELFATKPGPSAVLGPRAVAFAIGNTVHMVKVGADRIETGTRSSLDVPGSTPSRRRLTARKAL
ncbi:hypothetical protein M8818_006773 [Zalaria obscura]|uniref:Uncharacterized protein n=1 Tax=Zalaria obscura TaxID=2024903 RepID=A0ACC3S5X4_9PEZI